jgi:hypothetical protein
MSQKLFPDKFNWIKLLFVLNVFKGTEPSISLNDKSNVFKLIKF